MHSYPEKFSLQAIKFTTLLYRLSDKERYEMLERYISITEQISSRELSHLLAPFSNTPEIIREMELEL